MKITENCWKVIFAAEHFVNNVAQEELTGEAWENYHDLKDTIVALNSELMQGYVDFLDKPDEMHL